MNNWINVKKRLPTEQCDVLIAVRNKNKEDGIWLYEVSFWCGDEFERSQTWEDILYWKYIEEPKE
jgi:hypothetical protein